MGFLNKDNVPRKLTDEDVLEIYDQFDNRSDKKVSLSAWCKNNTNKHKLHWQTYYQILKGILYRYMMPGQPYRINYDTQNTKN
jgi:hypothetical protein